MENEVRTETPENACEIAGCRRDTEVVTEIGVQPAEPIDRSRESESPEEQPAGGDRGAGGNMRGENNSGNEDVGQRKSVS